MATKRRVQPATAAKSADVGATEVPRDVPQAEVTTYQHNPLAEVLAAYGSDGASDPLDTVYVEVLRSHDGRYEGEVIPLPNNDRTAGLISGGYVAATIPPPR